MVFFLRLLILLLGTTSLAFAQSDNQTQELSPVVQNQFDAFQIRIEQADFNLPEGIQSYAWAIYKGKWIFLAGRTNGMHSFGPADNFPPSKQNTTIFVVDPSTGTVFSRSLLDPSSGLSQAQVDSLSVTAPQSYWKGRKLYITGGYGVDTATGQFSTKDLLTSIDIPSLIDWVVNPSPGQTALQSIRQLSNPIFQVTGGDMYQIGHHDTLLVFGQNFTGSYTDSSNGSYTKQVRRFQIIDVGPKLSVEINTPKPCKQDPAYRRRDLNVVPVIRHNKFALTVYGGVFTPNTGVWTVPVTISGRGNPKMANPYHDGTFKQAMNQYQCAHLGVYSKKAKAMHTVLCGGISFGFIQDGTFQTDSEIPFINQTTTITRDKHGNYTQYLMNNTYPVILSTQSNPGNPLLFGAGARFLMAEGIPVFGSDSIKIIDLDAMGSMPMVVGYIVGGIQSTLPNTNTRLDSAASSYVFKVTLIPSTQ